MGLLASLVLAAAAASDVMYTPEVTSDGNRIYLQSEPCPDRDGWGKVRSVGLKPESGCWLIRKTPEGTAVLILWDDGSVGFLHIKHFRPVEAS